MGSNRGISVIICTYNGGKRINNVLDHLVEQKDIIKSNLEIIVVDNNSEDDTKNKVLDFAEIHDTRIIYCCEKKQGLLYARRTGIGLASKEFVVFCDDDNLLCNDYLAKMLEEMESNSNLGACGGRGVEMIVDGFEPNWFQQYKKSYAIGEQFVSSISTLYGAGVCFRLSALKNLYDTGFVGFLAGRTGNLQLAGDDGEIILALRILGFEISARNDCWFFHEIPGSRLSDDYLLKLYMGFGLMFPIVRIYQHFLRRGRSKNRWSYYLLFFYEIFKLILSIMFNKRGFDRVVFLKYLHGIFRGLYMHFTTITKLNQQLNSFRRTC